ncbi:hypothetical protein [Mycobacteroides abscessus]|uniref:hypothetical protein n=1 Tax=Mycobacteroides abscessus TaxID=36809 RepID=UPI00070C2606|nr:hypothetical protein [Mycobacteroides abscessus]ALM19064.1 hypothetical protein AOY11_25080 [Mycobacteroides abscessus]AMU49389.1 hypothetical protein A3O01_03935 [Mycobacteroides abscessus]ANO08060.1 hypothetical protein BAB76_03935 [Mycobacteroides abscessus]MDM3921121.1 hypothetical protein [Mycobacteroides abscessus]MDO2965038.1 hypothetical protein [Mycobacteroides abscessus subsp. abscessus]
MRLDEQAIADKLYTANIRARIRRDYALGEDAETPMRFVDQIIDGFNQHPSDLATSRSNAEVFKAAVWALGSNSRSWATFLRFRDKLTDALAGLNPVLAREADITTLATLLPGQTSTGDAKAILAWANLLADFDEAGERYYDGVLTLADTIKGNAASQGIDLPDEQLMLCVVGHLIDEPPKRWDGPTPGKLRGMRFALGSEFFRNLGWNGFKPDRHVIRLLDGWARPLVEEQADTAQQLARLAGRDTREVREIMRYSLAGIAISPSINYSRTDNLIWLLGAYVATKRHTDRHGFGCYLTP